jgi:L-ribulose-5-phosphate 3-epimerase
MEVRPGDKAMNEFMTGRREFLRYASAVAAGTSLLTATGRGQGTKPPERPLKALQANMLPKTLLDAQKFALAKKCGFEGIELDRPIEDLKIAEEVGAQAKQAGVPIHSVVFGGWQAPLSDPRPEVADKGLAGMETAMRCVKAAGGDVVLLVPALVTEEVGYAQAYERSQKNIRKLLPLAQELGVVIAVENVWNRFLLSPMEFARYVDEFDSPWVRAYVDVGNMILFGYAQDWIRTLGTRIVRIHLKDFKRPSDRKGYEWTNLLDGDVNWPQVRRALAEINFTSYMTAELPGGDEAYLTDLAHRIDKILAMKPEA